jgi:hypothetical protein
VEVVDGLFKIVNGVVMKDPRALISGLPALQRSVCLLFS